MNILHVITGLRKIAGTSTFCGEVCNQLVALGHDVTIAVCDPAVSDAYPLDPRVHLVSIDSILQPSYAHATSTYSLVHIHGLWSWSLHRVSCWAHAHNKPVVWSTHGMTASWALRHKWWKKCVPWFFYQKPDLKKAWRVHCTSDLEIGWNQNLGLMRTFLAPLGTFVPSQLKIRSTISTVGTLLFVGRIYPVKALDRLIMAFVVAIEKMGGAETLRDAWKLRLVGPDQAGHMAELMALCDRLGLSYSTPEGKYFRHSIATASNNNSSSPQVEFAGPKFGKDVDAEYANCDALALVSHTENFGATVVDALAHGKPVITSTKTPWKIVENHECGWWVDNDVNALGAAVFQLLNCSTSQRRAMGKNGLQLVRDRFTWSAVTRSIESAYESATLVC